MTKALKVRVTTTMADSIVSDTEMAIQLVHESSKKTFTAKIPTRNDYRAVDCLLLNVFRCDGWSILEDKDPLKDKLVAYLPDMGELRPSIAVFSLQDYMKGVTEKDYDLTAECDKEYAMLYKRIRGEVTK